MGAPPTAAPAAQVKTERLLNLVIALLATRMPLSKARIRAAVPQYHGTASDEAFDRMFERDKDELRELGIPLVTAVIDPVFDDELGYRIDKREYALPEIAFEPDEVTALSLAARTWTRASLAGSAASALRKLRAAGVVMDERSLVGIEPVVRTTEEAFEPLRRAVRDRQVVTFGYRKPEGESATRHLQPWGLAQWHGRWYLTGHDLDRGSPRVFRVSRVDGSVRTVGPVGAYEIPADHDPRSMVETTQVLAPAPRGPPHCGCGSAAATPCAAARWVRRSTRTAGRGCRSTSATSTGWRTSSPATDRMSSPTPPTTCATRSSGACGARRPRAERVDERPPDAAAESATSRLSRLLDMVPWLLAHQGVALETAAAEFGVTPEQLVADLELLFVCGTPGGMPDDLIEADWEDGRVFIGNADVIARPLRLSVDEALALMVGLRALATTPGLADHDAVARTLSKLEEATGAVGAPSTRVQVSIDDGARASVLRRARRRGAAPPAAPPRLPRRHAGRGHRA